MCPVNSISLVIVTQVSRVFCCCCLLRSFVHWSVAWHVDSFLLLRFYSLFPFNSLLSIPLLFLILFFSFGLVESSHFFLFFHALFLFGNHTLCLLVATPDIFKHVCLTQRLRLVSIFFSFWNNMRISECFNFSYSLT